MQNHIQRANFVVNCMVNCFKTAHTGQLKSAEPWVDTGSWCSSASIWYTGAALPNDDDEIIQLTEGGKLEEQQEPKLTTPEIPRELIGYEWTSDSDDSDGEDYP